MGCAKDPESQRIAHAGGGYLGENYTNSFEALNKNFRKGFRLYEIDFSWTADNYLVCIHDWQASFKRSFGFTTEKTPTLETFKLLVKTKSPYHQCTLQELAQWMEKHPKMILITDIKKNNIKALELISKKIINFKHRVIPQIYQPENYSRIKQLGFNNIIWTLYKFNGNNYDVLSWVNQMEGLYAVTMPTERAITGLGRHLQESGIYTYTHTINKTSALEFYQNLGIDNIYTDFLPPN